MWWPVTVLMAGFVVSAHAADKDDSETDLRKLEGTWEIVSIEAGGKKVDAGKGAPEKAVIKHGKATFFAAGKEMPTFKDLKLELDTKRKPKAVDLVRGEKEVLPCIYELTADVLKLAMPLVPAEKKAGESLSRPKSFDSKGEPFLVLSAKQRKG
jgi:uncharacterized protein (TIGR03067 family)